MCYCQLFTTHFILTLFLYFQLAAQNKALADELRLLKEATQHQTQQQAEQYRLLQQHQQSPAVCDTCKHNISEGPKKDLDSSALTDNASKSEEMPVPVEKDWLLLARISVWNMATQNTLVDCSTDSLSAALQEYLSSHPVSTSTDATTESASPTAPIHGNGSGIGDNDSLDFSAACDLLIMYINNIIKNPTVPRYRRISTTNNSYLKSLSSLLGHEAMLSALGFVRKPESNYFEYEWYNLPSSSSSSSSSTSTNTKAVTLTRPGSSSEAGRLLEDAVQLLAALKTSPHALASLLLSKLTETSSVAADSIGTDSAATDISVVENKINESSPLARVDNTRVGTNAPAELEPSLISVVDVSENENIDENEESAGVDFMKILKLAQESKNKTA